MTKKVISYDKTAIYKIACKDPSITDVYVGSTTNVNKRRYKHKYFCYDENSSKYNFKVYDFIRKNGGWDNWDLVVIEEYPCENKIQMLQRERHHLEQLQATLNSKYPYRTKEEAKEMMKNYMIDYNKKYRQENKHTIRLYKRAWRQKQKEKKELEKLNDKFETEIILDACDKLDLSVDEFVEICDAVDV